MTRNPIFLYWSNPSFSQGIRTELAVGTSNTALYCSGFGLKDASGEKEVDGTRRSYVRGRN